MREDVCRLERLEEALLVLFKFGKYRLELRQLFWTDTGKRDPKSIAIDPTHRGFVDPQRPIQAWNMESAFELRTLLHLPVAFDFTTAGRNIQSSSLPLLLLPREGASKLGGEPWLDPPILWQRFSRSLIRGF
jgi:hypothetical protein